MLFGITRELILKVAHDLLPIYLHPVSMADLPLLQEAFLSSSGRGIVPIVKIDDCVVGSGEPGLLTLDIARHYQACASRLLSSMDLNETRHYRAV